MGIPNDDSYQRSVLKKLRLKSQPISGQNWRTTRPTSTSQEKKRQNKLRRKEKKKLAKKKNKKKGEKTGLAKGVAGGALTTVVLTK